MAGTNKQGPQEGQSKEQERQQKKDEGEKNATTSEKKKRQDVTFILEFHEQVKLLHSDINIVLGKSVTAM